MNQRTPNYKKCFLLRLPFLSPLLYLALFHRETSGRTPRELRINSAPQKSTFLKIALWLKLKKVDSLPKKVYSHPKLVNLVHSALIFERAYEYSSLLISPLSHWGIVSKYSSIRSLPVTLVHLVWPFALTRRDKHSFSSQNLHICKNYCNFAPVISPRLGIMSLRVGDYKT
jgi:hypothetical protein